MSVAVHCDGCGKTVAEKSWVTVPDDRFEVPASMWVIEPPTQDKLRRYRTIIHLCDRWCLVKWVQKQVGEDGP